MKCQIPFSGKNKKNISVCCLPKILARVLIVNLDTGLKISFTFRMCNYLS